MKIENQKIDSGKAFDWGETSSDYAKYRDIYPVIFYDKIIHRNLCLKNQTVLDLGTGTGVIPRNMYQYGAKWIGTDISEMQIAQAKRLAQEMNQNIQYFTMPTEELDFPDHSFDVITACQCFWYFDYEQVIPKLLQLLKKDGRLLFLYMAWLPFDDKIAGASENLVLKYNPKWSGAGETKHPIVLPECIYKEFVATYHEEYDIDIPFTRETWHGRMKTCRGIGASLSQKEIENWEKEHQLLLANIAPENFSIKHYVAMLELKRK